MSDVWAYFQRTTNNDNNISLVKCKLCEAKYGSLTSTTTLRRHLQNIHASTYILKSLPKESSSYTYAEQLYITKKLVQWITVHLQLFNIVEQVQF